MLNYFRFFNRLFTIYKNVSITPSVNEIRTPLKNGHIKYENFTHRPGYRIIVKFIMESFLLSSP